MIIISLPSSTTTKLPVKKFANHFFFTLKKLIQEIAHRKDHDYENL